MYDNLSAYEFLSFVSTVKQVHVEDRREQIASTLELTGLSDAKRRKIRTFSGGMKRRLGIAQALIGNPSVLIVDEPTVGLDPQERVRFRNLLVELARDRLILLSSHITEDVAHTCPRLAILDHGRLRFCGDIQTLLHTAHDYVWEFVATSSTPQQDDVYVVSSSQTSDGIRYRVLSNSKPTKDATPTSPTIEDAYLRLLHF